MDKHRKTNMVTYPYIGEMMIIPIEGKLIYFGHVVTGQGRGTYTLPCTTEDAAMEAAKELLEKEKVKK